jgi:hypothetical protein
MCWYDVRKMYDDVTITSRHILELIERAGSLEKGDNGVVILWSYVGN